MPTGATIRAIAFDAYGTLFDVYSVAATADAAFPGRGTELAALWRDRQIEYTWLRTMSGRYADFLQVTGDALDFACARLGLALDADTRARLLAQYEVLAAFPENGAALHRLKALGLPLAILSNGTPSMLASAVESAGFSGIFDHVLSVDAVQQFKTASAAYQLGPEAFGCPAQEILFVSSNSWDVCGATWFGYTTFWVNRTGLPPERLGVDPTAEGRSLDDLVAFVGRLSEKEGP